MMSDFRVIQGCPVKSQIAPYIYLVTKKAHVNSIYRGSDAKAILHYHGKMTQAEIHRAYPSISNPEGQSTHDGHTGGAYPGPKNKAAEWWQQGFDVNDADVAYCITRAKYFGWELWRPYPRGAEYHHLNFKRQPKSGHNVHRTTIIAVRASLPRR